MSESSVMKVPGDFDLNPDVSNEIYMLQEEKKSSRFSIRPPIEEKFNSVVVKEVLKSVIYEELAGKKYSSFDPAEMVCHVGALILEKLNELPYKRYKYVCSVTIAEKKGQGMRYSSSCRWDPDTDGTITQFILTEYLVGLATVHAVYYY